MSKKQEVKMTEKLDMHDIIVVSEGVVAREIEGEFIIIPLVSGIGDLEDDLYLLNETGKAIWNNLDGERTLGQIIGMLSEKFDSYESTIKEDVLGLINELLKRNMVKKKE
jgi:hypothetical protein